MHARTVHIEGQQSKMYWELSDSLRRIHAIVEEYAQVPEVYTQLHKAAVDCLSDLTAAVDKYNIDLDIELLNRSLISALMTFVDIWDIWITGLGPGSLKHRASKTFHEFLLRFSKGVLKAWRIWRIDLKR